MPESDVARTTAVVPSWSASSTEIVTSACASSVRSMLSTEPTGWPATRTSLPATSWPPFWNIRWYVRPELPPNRITSTSTRPTRRAPPAATREIHARRPRFTAWSSGATCPGLGAPSSCTRCCERPAHPAGTSFPSRAGAACPGSNAVSPRPILLLFLPGLDRPFRAEAVAAGFDTAPRAALFARIAAGEGAIEVVRAGAGERPDDRRRGARTGARLHKPAQSVDGERQIRSLGPRRSGRSDDEDDLALDVLAEAPRGLECHHGLRGAKHPLELARPARQESLEAPAVGR